MKTKYDIFPVNCSMLLKYLLERSLCLSVAYDQTVKLSSQLINFLLYSALRLLRCLNN